MRLDSSTNSLDYSINRLEKRFRILDNTAN